MVVRATASLRSHSIPSNTSLSSNTHCWDYLGQGLLAQYAYRALNPAVYSPQHKTPGMKSSLRVQLPTYPLFAKQSHMGKYHLSVYWGRGSSNCQRGEKKNMKRRPSLSEPVLEDASKYRRGKTLIVLLVDMENILLSLADMWMWITGAMQLLSLPVGFLEWKKNRWMQSSSICYF